MNGTYELYIEAGNVSIDAVFIKPYGAEPGRHAGFFVTDTGIDNLAKTILFKGRDGFIHKPFTVNDLLWNIT